MSLGAAIALALNIGESNDGDLQKAVNTINYKKNTDIANGTGSGQANKAWSDQRSIAASGTDSLDLAGTLVDAFGQTITFTSIKAIIIVASGDNQDNIEIGGNANAFASFFGDPADTLILKPGGMIALTAPGAGYAVTATTGDILDLVNADSSNASVYDVILVGVAS